MLWLLLVILYHYASAAWCGLGGENGTLLAMPGQSSRVDKWLLIQHWCFLKLQQISMYTVTGTHTFELHRFHCCEPMVMVHKCLHRTRRWWHFMPLALTLHMKCSVRRDVLCIFWKHGNKFVDMSAGTRVQLTVLRKHILLCWQVYLDNGDNEGNDNELSRRRRKVDGLLRIQVSRLLAAQI